MPFSASGSQFTVFLRFRNSGKELRARDVGDIRGAAMSNGGIFVRPEFKGQENGDRKIVAERAGECTNRFVGKDAMREDRLKRRETSK